MTLKKEILEEWNNWYKKDVKVIIKKSLEEAIVVATANDKLLDISIQKTKKEDLDKFLKILDDYEYPQEMTEFKKGFNADLRAKLRQKIIEELK